jgi:hypothetical protein
LLNLGVPRITHQLHINTAPRSACVCRGVCAFRCVCTRSVCVRMAVSCKHTHMCVRVQHTPSPKREEVVCSEALARRRHGGCGAAAAAGASFPVHRLLVLLRLRPRAHARCCRRSPLCWRHARAPLRHAVRASAGRGACTCSKASRQQLEHQLCVSARRAVPRPSRVQVCRATWRLPRTTLLLRHGCTLARGPAAAAAAAAAAHHTVCWASSWRWCCCCWCCCRRHANTHATRAHAPHHALHATSPPTPSSTHHAVFSGAQRCNMLLCLTGRTGSPSRAT